MTDIEFDQIREGQTVRLHLGDHGMQITATARTNAYTLGGADWRFDVEDWLTLKGFAVTRVELLSEPAPKWEVGQLAEVTWTCATHRGDRPCTELAQWDAGDDDEPPCWVLVQSGGRLLPEHLDGEPRLLVAVPADARVVTQDCVVLPPSTESPAVIRSNADYMEACFAHNHPAGVATLRALADAIEEAQR